MFPRLFLEQLSLHRFNLQISSSLQIGFRELTANNCRMLTESPILCHCAVIDIKFSSLLPFYGNFVNWANDERDAAKLNRSLFHSHTFSGF